MTGEKSERRRQFTAEEKAIILRRHLSEKVAVSDLCEEYKIQPSLFYVWQRQAFEYYLSSVLDGATRFMIHWELRECMKERDVETVLQRAREKYPDAFPRIISDNGPQFIAKGFKEFIRMSGMTHVRTSPYYPQSNGKLERWHQTLKVTTIRHGAPATLDEARRLMEGFVKYFNHERLHSTIGFITPAPMLAGRGAAIWQHCK